MNNKKIKQNKQKKKKKSQNLHTKHATQDLLKTRKHSIVASMRCPMRGVSLG